MIVIVAPLTSSTDKEAGATAIVDWVAEPGPAIKVMTSTSVKVILSVVLVAVMFFTSAFDEFMVAVSLPLASVVRAAWLMVLLVPVDETVIFFPDTGLPY